MSAAVLLVDVSAAQTISDAEWKSGAAAGLAGVYVKATEGQTHVSPAMLTHARAVAAAGIQLGYYHVCTPGDAPEDAVREAEWYIRSLSDAGAPPATLRPALDIERPESLTPDALAQWAIDWSEVVEDLHRPALLGARCLLYCNKSTCRHLGKAAPILVERLRERFHLWLAGDNSRTPSPSPWPSPVLWQTPRRDLPWTRERIDVDIAETGMEPLYIASVPLAMAGPVEALCAELEAWCAGIRPITERLLAALKRAGK